MSKKNLLEIKSTWFSSIYLILDKNAVLKYISLLLFYNILINQYYRWISFLMSNLNINKGVDKNCTLVTDLLVREEDIEVASRSLKAISHPLRLKILCVLGGNEVSVQDIVECVGTSQSNISQHLAILRDKGILASRKEANRVYYRVGDSRTLKLISMMQEVFCSAP